MFCQNVSQVLGKQQSDLSLAFLLLLGESCFELGLNGRRALPVTKLQWKSQLHPVIHCAPYLSCLPLFDTLRPSMMFIAYALHVIR